MPENKRAVGGRAENGMERLVGCILVIHSNHDFPPNYFAIISKLDLHNRFCFCSDFDAFLLLNGCPFRAHRRSEFLRLWAVSVLSTHYSYDLQTPLVIESTRSSTNYLLLQYCRPYAICVICHLFICTAPFFTSISKL